MDKRCRLRIWLSNTFNTIKGFLTRLAIAAVGGPRLKKHRPCPRVGPWCSCFILFLHMVLLCPSLKSSQFGTLNFRRAKDPLQNTKDTFGHPALEMGCSSHGVLWQWNACGWKLPWLSRWCATFQPALVFFESKILGDVFPRSMLTSGPTCYESIIFWTRWRQQLDSHRKLRRQWGRVKVTSRANPFERWHEAHTSSKLENGWKWLAIRITLPKTPQFLFHHTLLSRCCLNPRMLQSCLLWWGCAYNLWQRRKPKDMGWRNWLQHQCDSHLPPSWKKVKQPADGVGSCVGRRPTPWRKTRRVLFSVIELCLTSGKQYVSVRNTSYVVMLWLSHKIFVACTANHLQDLVSLWQIVALWHRGHKNTTCWCLRCLQNSCCLHLFALPHLPGQVSADPIAPEDIPESPGREF